MLSEQNEIKLIELFKFCAKCGILKLYNNGFHKQARGLFGRRSVCKSCGKIWFETNKEKLKLYRKIYRKNNKEKMNAATSAWLKNNPKRKHYMNIYVKKRIKTDPKFKLNSTIRSAVGKSLKGNKNGKHWEDLVGFTLKQLKKHLEKQFIEGMTWENQGSIWHIDHKIPISVFNFTRPEHRDFKRCWALKNLQPMWAIENIKKKDKIIKHFQPSLPI